MVTKYDVFEIVYQNRIPTKPKEAVALLGKEKPEYNNIRMLLVLLVQEGLLVKTRFGFQAASHSKADLLFSLIRYCVRNSINYNNLLNQNLISFIAKALYQGEITTPTSNINPKTFQQYVETLSPYGLILIRSKKPWKVKIFYNSLVKNLLLYYDIKPKFKLEKINYLPDIEQELHLFNVLQKKNEVKYTEIIDEMRISFVHHSLLLEGNPLTLPETIKVIRHKILPKEISLEAVEEIQNYQKATLEMLKDSRKKGNLTLPLILQYHKIALQHRPDIAGKIRTVEVRIHGNPLFEIAKAKDIEVRLNKLLGKYYTFMEKKKKSIKEIIQFAAYFHNEFQHIHPFVDGNSRTTRLLTLYILQVEGLPILDLPLGLLDEYMNLTKKSSRRIDKDLYSHLQKIILWNLKVMNRELKGGS